MLISTATQEDDDLLEEKTWVLILALIFFCPYDVGHIRVLDCALVSPILSYLGKTFQDI